MTKTIYNKLVRDKIADIIFAEGKRPECFVLSDGDFLNALIDKLHEETLELIDAISNPKEELEELADLYEVMNAIRIYLKITPEKLEEARNKKNHFKGAFKRKLFLYSVEDYK